MDHRRYLRRCRLTAATVAALTVAALAGGGPAATAQVSERTPPGQGQQPVATGRGGAVASVDLDASRAGIEVLRHGGNAIDAAVAVASTLGVTEPYVAGPGGGGFMVIYLAREHRVVTIDGREACPAACTSKPVRRERPTAALPGRPSLRTGGRRARHGGDLGGCDSPVRRTQPGHRPATGHQPGRPGFRRRRHVRPGDQGVARRAPCIHREPSAVPRAERQSAGRSGPG